MGQLCVITKWGNCYYKAEQLLLQSGTGSFITKWDNFITKRDGYYKVGRALQSGPFITKSPLVYVTAVYSKDPRYQKNVFSSNDKNDQKVFRSKGEYAVLLMDQCKAFDCLLYGLIVSKLQAYGFVMPLLRFIQSNVSEIRELLF